MATLIEYNKKQLKGEKVFWELLNNDPFFKNWTVIWGLGISEHKKKLDGQSDFVLIGPLGIAVIEIKGGDIHIFNKDGTFEWGYQNSSEPLMKSKETPFMQAGGNMYSIKNYLLEKYSSKSKIQNTLFAHGCAFPEGDLTKIKNKSNIQYHDWQIWDSNSSDIKEYIVNLFKNTENKLHEIAPKVNIENLTLPQINHIIQFLAIEGKCVIKINKENQIKREIIKLQDEQCEVYKSDYKKICIDGGPGTGKSIVAEFIANKLISENKKVLWVSFNKFFTESIQNKFSNNGLIDVKKSTQMALDICRRDGVDLEFSDPNLHDEFALSALNLLENGDLVQYDAIVWDEAQDNMTQPFFDALNSMMKGGWDKGSWYVFLDSQIQSENLNRLDVNVLKKIKELCELKMPFKINYRNSSDVISYASKYSGIDAPECKSTINGNVTKLINEDNQKNFLEDKIFEIVNSGVSNPILLTYQKPQNFVNSIDKLYFSKLGASANRYIFRPYSPKNKKEKFCIDYANVISYKGLENNDVILYWPIKYYDSKFRSDIFYTALSRAFNNVYIILDNYDVNSKLIE